jgi:colanic acid biosynthesis glycosyl transferase WcaI
MTENGPRVTVIGLNYAPEPTGIAPYTAGLASGLAGLGWSVRAITAFPHYPAWKFAEGYRGHRIDERIKGVDVTRVRPYLPQRLTGIKRVLLEVSFGVRSAFVYWGRPDVVVLVSPALFAVAVAQLRARLMPRSPAIVVWVQDIYSVGVTETGTLGRRGARVIAHLESAVLRRADAVVAIHARFKRYLASSLKVEETKIEIVRNWTHLPQIVVDREEYRSRFGWENKKVILHAGNMGAKQALENIVEAARIAESRGLDLNFVLLGDGNQREKLLTMGRGVSTLEFMQSLSDVDFQGAMAAADILLVNEKPGVTEMAVPSKLTSYFAAQRPVIVATDRDSITAEELEAAGAGVRVEADNPEALINAVLQLGREVDAAQSYGKNGADFQATYLSQTAAISHYAEIIRGLASKRGREARL